MDIARPLAVALVLSLAAVPVMAQQQRVYQWKDANGVSHYTDTPPPQAHQTRDFDNHGTPATPATPAKPMAKAEESRQCADARANLQRLQSEQSVGIDTNSDGKADRNLSAAERNSQVELNQAAIKAYCTPAR